MQHTASARITKIDKIDLKTLSPEALIEGFVHEATLNKPGVVQSVEEMNGHGKRADAYLAEIASRGGLESLAVLMDSPDHWLAYYLADYLAYNGVAKERAMVVLDRIADGRFGSASSAADTARNMMRYGNPFGDPIEVEKDLAEIRARDGAQ